MIDPAKGDSWNDLITSVSFVVAEGEESDPDSESLARTREQLRQVSQDFYARTKSSHGDVLSPEQETKIVGRVREFWNKRLEWLGIEQTPPVVGPFLKWRNDSGASGHGNPRHRLVRMEEPIPKDDYEETLLVGRAVHEFGHAIAQFKHRILSSGEYREVSTGWNSFLCNPGARKHTDLVLFETFEEVVNHYANALFLKENGVSAPFESVTELVNYAGSPEDDVLLSAALEIYHAPFLFGHVTVSIEGTAAQLASIFGYRIPQVRQYFACEEKPSSASKYAYLPAIFETLARELDPQGGAEASDALMDDLARAAITGEKKELLSRMLDVYGPDGLRFLALARPTDSYVQPGVDTRYLRLFADAGQLPSEQRRRIRDSLCESMFTRYEKIDWVAALQRRMSQVKLEE